MNDLDRSERRIRNNKIRRRRERRKNILLALLTVCLIITFSFMVSGFLSHASTKREAAVSKYYKSILIGEGDTLWSIAVRNKAAGMDTKAFVEEIKQMNRLYGDTITMGNYLVVPYYTAGDIHGS